MNNTCSKALPLALLAILSSGCGSGSDKQTPEPAVTVLYQDSQCPFFSEKRAVINQKDEFALLLDRAGGGKKSIPAMHINAGQPVNAADLFAANTQVLVEAFDFNSASMVLIARGAQPNPGYGMEVVGSIARVNSGVLQLPVKYLSPEPEKLYPQVTISPCVLLKVDNTELPSTLDVIEQ